MSEERKDIESNNASMDNSEFESSDMIEVNTDMQSPRVQMSSAEFETTLTEFFTKHKKSKLHLVSRIVFEFKGYENIVLEHLNNKYVLNVTTVNRTPRIEHNISENTEHPKEIGSSKGENSKTKTKIEPATKPKSKSKLIIIIIIIVVVLAGLGVGGFLMKDKIMGMIGMGHKTEEAPKVKAESESKPEATPPPKEEPAPVAEITDSTTSAAGTTTTDSVITH